MKLSHLLLAPIALIVAPGCLTLFDDDLPAPPLMPDACVACGCQPSTETCNGRDDDCDDRVDEESDALCGPRTGGRATCEAGACRLSCDIDRRDIDGIFDNGCEYTCTPSAGGVESCDGADNDCDGIADEALIGDVVPGLRGVCAGARRACDGRSGWGDPRFDSIASFEADERRCDGLDNDCDGTIDEAQPPGERCHRCDGSTEPPCNGCPAETIVPGGWVCIPPGDFVMGSEPDAVWHVDDEAPVQPVRITRPFLMMATELTQQDWMTLTGRNPARDSAENERPCDAEAPGECPVERVSWYDAIGYANRLSRSLGLPPCYDEAALARCRGTPGGGCPGDGTCSGGFTCEGDEAFDNVDIDCPGIRLPTEAEWEYAARAGTTGLFWFPDERFDEIPTLEWLDHPAGAPRSNPVGRLTANPWGLYDMLGNVSEWVHGRYRAYPEVPPPASDPHRDQLPQGPDLPPERAARGGSWLHVPANARAAQRWHLPPDRRDNFFGVRFIRGLMTDE